MFSRRLAVWTFPLCFVAWMLGSGCNARAPKTYEIQGDDCLHKIVYDARSKTLTVYFNKRGVYAYDGVPQSQVEDLLKDPCRGCYFNLHVRDSFKYKRVA